MTITVYSKDNCVQCNATRRFLDNRDIPYNVMDAVECAQELRNKGFSQAPVVVVHRPDGSTRSWGGYNVGLLQELEKTVVHSSL